MQLTLLHFTPKITHGGDQYKKMVRQVLIVKWHRQLLKSTMGTIHLNLHSNYVFKNFGQLEASKP